MSDHLSNDGLGFDPLDDTLGRALRDSAPGTVDADATLAALRPRLESARRRRRAMVVGASTLAVLAIGALAFAVVPATRNGHVETPPATRPDAVTTTTIEITPAPTQPSADPTVVPPGGTGPGATTATTDDKGGSTNSGGGSDGGDDSSHSGSSGDGSGSSGGHGGSGSSGTSGSSGSSGGSGTN
jgi:hypothetical protein